MPSPGGVVVGHAIRFRFGSWPVFSLWANVCIQMSARYWSGMSRSNVGKSG